MPNFTREQFIQDLRDAADLYEQAPNLLVPNRAIIFSFDNTKEQLKSFSKAFGHVVKSVRYPNEEYAELRLTWKSPSGSLEIECSAQQRDMCERRLVTKQVYEYECDPILLDEETADSEATNANA